MLRLSKTEESGICLIFPSSFYNLGIGLPDRLAQAPDPGKQ